MLQLYAVRAGCGLLIVTDTEFTDMSANMVKTPQSNCSEKEKPDVDDVSIYTNKPQQPALWELYGWI